MPGNTLTRIISPYHSGLRDHRIGNGPRSIQSLGLLPPSKNGAYKSARNRPELRDRSRRISSAVTEAMDNNTFLLILAGNCMSSAAMACGRKAQALSFIYFDAHDDLDLPDVNENEYFDAMGLSMLRGVS
ncbi:hypothetical protein ETB97_005398 [Aspergillus alliaceus]|uniref:Arginase n=2 Tax=Petromyces alliaceus TaxID=209559 RepID=A0A8H5ZWS1_PETAA|nr:hypothetical protein ETB97_005398 [Aspergillus burnettii]